MKPYARLLLVEDEEETLTAMQQYLMRQGFHVDCAQEREAAEALISAEHYEVVITDLRLTPAHGTEGLDIASHVRQASPGTRVVILTAYGSPEIASEAKLRGVDAFVTKTQPLSSLARLVLGYITE